MSYSIYIGEAKFRYTTIEEAVADYRELPTRNPVVVDELRLEDAPTFPGDGMTGNSNGRHPAYGAWSDFCRTVGLYEFFYDKQVGLMRKHPGAFQIEKRHVELVAGALQRYRDANPNAVPGWNDDQDAALARLIWLEWWMRWALENCKYPAIYNY